MKSCFAFTMMMLLTNASANADLVISQYIETSSGTSPKGIELWNSGASTIDFSATPLSVFWGNNGNALAELSGAAVASGTLGANQVLVIGTPDIGTYLDTTFGSGVVPFVNYGFLFNGDDALQIQLDGTATDTFGTVGNDPGSAWTGSGVSTANQNIALLTGITTGNVAGFSDPSTRFGTVSTDNSLTGFGVAPVAVPEASAFLFGGLSLAMAGLSYARRRRG